MVAGTTAMVTIIDGRRAPQSGTASGKILYTSSSEGYARRLEDLNVVKAVKASDRVIHGITPPRADKSREQAGTERAHDKAICTVTSHESRRECSWALDLAGRALILAVLPQANVQKLQACDGNGPRVSGRVWTAIVCRLPKVASLAA